ncbi:MAG TPA: carboxypeptidase regulatory-like domain-containing protein [Candidatus Dormibacteraeota bacterium]|nr:carboxypeptidase regulatory-like domain-containing protein [Candidatus Dormibacteraeota bacterium]
MKVENYLFIVVVLLLSLCVPWSFGQDVTGALRGQVTDPSGAAIPGASVILTPATGAPIVVQSSAQGTYEFKNMAAGKYILTVAASGFTLYENDGVVVADQPLRLNVALTIEVETQKVQVSDTAATIDVNPNSNAGAITISGKELEALPDDPDELLSDLQALAGPAAGPNGGQMYIDGFTAGQLPPKASIREIRINQNPFSSEYDKLGYGRIEIFTKPGTDKFHGQFFMQGNDSAFNSHNPFAGPQPGYDTTQYSGNVGGPLGKSASFFFNAERRNINDLAAISAETLDQNFQPLLTQESVANPRHRTNISPRLDYAVTKNNTLTARYQYYRDTEDNNGVGQFSLPSQGHNDTSTEQTFQIGDTQVYGSKIVNETRFQFLHESSSQSPLSTDPAISVRGAFGGGGSSQGTSSDQQNHYEVQNYTSLIHGNHTMKFGARVRALHDANISTSGFNGTFTFSSLAGSTDLTCHVVGDPGFLPSTTPCPVSYQYAQQQVQGGGTPYATQLSITTGLPSISLTTYDAGLYVQDDWRVRPNITLSYGLRFETQNAIHDRGDWAPRVGFAWGVGGRSAPPKVVIRGGFGMFYDRFGSDQILQTERVDGVVQQQYVINNPTCYPIATNCDLSSVGAAIPTIYEISPRLHAPYTLQTAVSVERQVTKSATLSLTYLSSRGFDQFTTINANAPGPPYNPANGNRYQYVSEANFRQNQLIANSNVRVGSKVQLFGYYTLNYANSDSSGVSSFASNSYNISQDYGRASFDTRNRLFLGGSIAFPYAIRLSPFMVASSGSPFNITAPNDLNGDSIFNDRPGVVSHTTCATTSNTPASTIYCTPIGTFDAAGASAGVPLAPINYGTGPSHFVLNLRLTKAIGFGAKVKGTSGNQGGPGGGGGPRGGGGHGPLFGGGPMMSGPSTDRRYNLTLGVNVRNVFNKVNTANPVGVLGSSFFDIPNALQGGPFSTGSAVRRIDLQATFSF